MRVLFTGATGVLGSAALPLLVEAGHDVGGVARSEDGRRRVAALGAMPVEIDLFDPEQVRAAVDGVEVVYHYATAIPPISRFRHPEAWENNDRLRRDATRVLVDASLEAGVGCFVQQSITFIYADGGDAWLDEESPVGLVSGVLSSALDAESEVARFSRGGGTGVILRHSRVYGPGNASAEYVAAVAARRVPVVGRGDNYISSIHVHDAAKSLVAALEVPAGAYNVSDDRPVTSWEYNASLAQALGAPPPRRVPVWLARLAAGPVTGLTTVSHRVSNRKLREATGWTPTYPSVVDGWPSVLS